MINMSYILIIPLKTIPDSRPKWAKSIPIFRQKHPTHWGSTYTYMAYAREYHPLPLPPGIPQGHKDRRINY